jgi:hypothetical protein
VSGEVERAHEVCACSVGTALAPLLGCIQLLSQHKTLFTWLTVDDCIVKMIIGYVNGSAKQEEDGVLLPCFSILGDMLADA